MNQLDNNTELQELRNLLGNINGQVLDFDEFCNSGLGEGYQDEDGLYNFGKTVNIGNHVFRLKSSTDTMFEKNTILSKAFDELLPKELSGFRGFTLHVYECDTQFFSSDYDFEPSITALQVDDKLHIVGYFNGLEV